MPRRSDIESVLVVGSGPIVIGQACEFDYSGTQACRVLAEEGFRVVLANSNPATIMTDPQMADRTYVEPLDPDVLAAIIERERPDALLPTLGGQTALNLTMDLVRPGSPRRVRGGGHRGQPRGHRHRRGPGTVQGGHGRDRVGRSRLRLRPLARRGAGDRRLDRLPGDGAAELHPGRRRHRHRRRTATGSCAWPARGSTPRRWARSSSSSRSPARRSSSSRSCVTAPTTAWSSAPSRTWTRWASTPVTRSRWPRPRPSPTSSTRPCATPPSPASGGSGWRRAGPTCSSRWTRGPAPRWSSR